jgi:hypothetical protein
LQPEVFLSQLKNQLQRFGLLIAGLTMLTLFTALSGLWHYQNELSSQSAGVQALAKTAKQTTPNPAVKSTAAAQSLEPGNAMSTPATTSQNPSTAGPTTAKSTAQSKNIASTTSQPAAAASPAIISLTLSVNGQAKSTVKLATGSSQCDLLSQALTDGIISSLDMRYSSQYGTEAVYVIDGIGDPGSVWWTYTVNGHAPPYGCAYVTAHNGDAVNWQYAKS